MIINNHDLVRPVTGPYMSYNHMCVCLDPQAPFSDKVQRWWRDLECLAAAQLQLSENSKHLFSYIHFF